MMALRRFGSRTPSISVSLDIIRLYWYWTVCTILLGHTCASVVTVQ
jgi:hypothetical protein